MSRRGDIEFDWAGEIRTFRLLIGEIEKLQERTNAGPLELLRRLSDGTWRVNDVREPIRLGLEGAGMSASQAGRLLRDYVDPPNPLLDSVLVAARIVNAALSGPPEDEIPVPKSEEAEAKPQSLKTESSLSPPSSAGAPSLDIPQPTSGDARSGSSKRRSPASSPRKARQTSQMPRPLSSTTTS